MDKNIVELYKEYGIHSNTFRAFPLSVDGLKLVERRILYAVHDLAAEKLTKCARIVGEVIGKYHPHSDASVYQSLVGLVQRNLLVDQGNFGSNIGVEPTSAAAMRYTETKLTPFIKSICFEHLKSTLLVENDLGEMEPAFLPTMFPICFLGNESVQGIGFGYKSTIPTYTIENLYKRLNWLLKKDNKYEPVFAPNFNCDILSDKTELKNLLTTGEAAIQVKGKIVEDPKNFNVSLTSWAESKSFQSILSNKLLAELLDNNSVGYADLSSNGKTNVVFEVLKKKNKQDIYDNMKIALDAAITSTIHYKNIVVGIDNKVRLKSIDEMLLETYEMFIEINKKSLQNKIEFLNKKLDDVKLLITLKPHLIKVMKNDKYSEMNFDEKVQELSNLSKIEISEVKNILQKNSIQRLLKIEDDTQDLENQIRNEKQKLINVNEYVWNQYSQILK